MIETDRLILRAPEPRDRAVLHAMWADAEVMRDLGPVKSPAESDAAIARHAGYRGAGPGVGGLGFDVVVRRADDVVIGFCGLKPGAPDTPIAGAVEAGWAFLPPYWGQGYAAEAMRAVLAHGWAHTDAPRIVAITAARNDRSQRLMTRLGMHRLADGDFLHPGFAPGHPLRASVTFAIDRPA